MNLTPEDLKLKLLMGDSIFVGDIEIKPIKLKEIVKIGYSKYNQYLWILTLDVKELLKQFNQELDENISLFDMILYYSKNEELITIFINALLFFLHGNEDTLELDENGLHMNGNIINSSNFNEIVSIIKYQSCIIDADKQRIAESDNPKAREMKEKAKKAKEIISKLKRGNSDILDLSDIISAVSTKSNTYNKRNIFNCTYYQLMDEFKRLNLIDKYEIDIKAMIAGAKIEKLQHWSSKITDEDN